MHFSVFYSSKKGEVFLLVVLYVMLSLLDYFICLKSQKDFVLGSGFVFVKFC